MLSQTIHLLSEGVALERITQIMKKEAGSLSLPLPPPPSSTPRGVADSAHFNIDAHRSFHFFFGLILFGGTLLLWFQMITSLLLSFTILSISLSLFLYFSENHLGEFLSLSLRHASKCGFIEKLSIILAALYYIH